MNAPIKAIPSVTDEVALEVIPESTVTKATFGAPPFSWTVHTNDEAGITATHDDGEVFAGSREAFAKHLKG